MAVSYGGVEIGQGINTKVSLSLPPPPSSLHSSSAHSFSHRAIFLQVAQVAAKTLGIPLEMVKVKPSMTLTNPNGQTTGGSTTSELNCLVNPLHQEVYMQAGIIMCVVLCMVGYDPGLSRLETSESSQSVISTLT